MLENTQKKFNSQSEELFHDLYNKMSQKIEESDGTIFSGVSIAKEVDSEYKLFMESHYSNMFFNDQSVYEKNRTIQLFIENEVLSELYTTIYDRLIAESDDSELSFSQELIMETTAEQFKVKYLGIDLHEIEKFEEVSLASAGAIAGVAAMAGPVPAIAFTAITFLGMNLLFPARWAKASDDFFRTGLGNLGKVAFNTQSILAMGNTSLAASNQNILNFDNIDVNPDVRKLFNTLSRSNNKKAPIDGINTIVANCMEKNDILNAGDGIEEPQKGFFRGLYSPRSNSVFTVFIETLFKNSASKKDQDFDTLIRYRKCLSEKLVDMYKFLMIANISQSRNYKKILSVMQRGFHSDPAQLLSFINTDTDQDIVNKDNIITLIKFRLFLEDMAKDLKRGAFDADTEASVFLTQKLKMVDNEIEDYLAKNKRQIETNFENREEFGRKDFKYKKPEDKTLKRKMFGFESKVK